MKVDLARFAEAFLEEAQEHLRALEEGLLALEKNPQEVEELHRIFRAAHSLKGSSSTFGFVDIARFTHGLETLLDRVRQGELQVTAGRTSVLLRAVDIVRALLDEARSGQHGTVSYDGLLAELETHAQTTAAEAPAPADGSSAQSSSVRRLQVRFVPGADVFRQGMDPALLLRDLRELGEVLEVECDLGRLPEWSAMDPESCLLSWTVTLDTAATDDAVRDVFAFVADTSEVALSGASGSAPVPATDKDKPAASGLRAPAGPHADATSLRVATEKVDRIINLVGELVISQSMILQALQQPTEDAFARAQEAALEMERNTRELQERVMAIRMVPAGNVFGRFPRLVRDLSAQLGKKIDLQISGADTEIDKSVVERLSDPLTHLVRNALDHGVETAQERVLAGKPETATVRLSAFHQGGSVVIEVEDDGRGLDAERIRQKAVAQGLLGEGETLDERQLHDLIFRPGFSTASEVTDLSGRGVGMDVVRSCVEALNGTVTVQSTRGRGTRLRLTLPLTLAILDGMTLRVGQGLYVLPITAIVESFRPRAEHLRTLFGEGEVVLVRGDPLPLVYLHRVLGADGAATDPTKALVVIAETGTFRFGLVIDELLAQSQVVIKSLDTHFHRVEGVMGATILGDGTVALLLDVQGIARLAGVGRRQGAGREWRGAEAAIALG